MTERDINTIIVQSFLLPSLQKSLFVFRNSKLDTPACIAAAAQVAAEP